MRTRRIHTDAYAHAHAVDVRCMSPHDDDIDAYLLHVSAMLESLHTTAHTFCHLTHLFLARLNWTELSVMALQYAERLNPNVQPELRPIMVRHVTAWQGVCVSSL